MNLVVFVARHLLHMRFGGVPRFLPRTPHPLRPTSARPIRALLAALCLTLVLAACTPSQALRFLADRGDPQARADIVELHEGDGLHGAEWDRYNRFAEVVNVLIFLSVWHHAQMADADYHARNNGAPGTCSETGIFLAESGGNWTARNPSSSAAGGFQFIRSTWNNYGGYASAADAPPSAQHAKFHELWANGAGRSHWTESVC